MPTTGETLPSAPSVASRAVAQEHRTLVFARDVQETVLKAADGGLGNVFARLQGTFPQSSAPSTSVVIDQQGCVYHPRIQGARVGQTLEVKNSDATLHNIHSMSTKGSDFNVGQPLAGMVYKYQLKTEEVMLHLKCDVHSWMTGYIGVVSLPYFAVTDTTGAFTIANVPAGKQTVQVWHEQYGVISQTVDVKAGGTTTVEFAYTGNEKPSTSQAALSSRSLSSHPTPLKPSRSVDDRRPRAAAEQKKDFV